MERVEPDVGAVLDVLERTEAEERAEWKEEVVDREEGARLMSPHWAHCQEGAERVEMGAG